MDRTYSVLRELNKRGKEIPGVSKVTFIAGSSLISGAGNNYGLAFLQLTDWEEREGNEDESIEAITNKLFALATQIPDAKMLFFSPPSVPGFGVSSSVCGRNLVVQ